MRSGSAPQFVLRVLTAAALAVSGYIHLHLAHLYRGLGDTVTQAQLFYAQGAVALVVAAVLLLTGIRLAWFAAALVGAASLAAVLLYRYVDVGAIGPIPNMHDGSWLPSPDKALSAVAEGAVVVLCLLYAVTARRAAGLRAVGAPRRVGS